MPFPPPDTGQAADVLDLFAGIGGLSLGFREAGFQVTGVDVEKASAAAFKVNTIGKHVLKDLRVEDELQPVSLVIGGPPCRPWSSVNLQKRGEAHEDHVLLQRFFHHLIEIRPTAFLMENVPPLLNDPDYLRLSSQMQSAGYSIQARALRYSDFGAATSRKRLFTFGIRDDGRWSATDFFHKLAERRAPALTVADAIGWLSDVDAGGVPDHQWSRLNTIGKYLERYRSGQYGWKKLDWDAPAPSFGSIAKTYVLHPDSDAAGSARVLSVREVLSIMGFSRAFRFAEGTALSRRYHMAANSVSPAVAAACARTIKEMLVGNGDAAVRSKQDTER